MRQFARILTTTALTGALLFTAAGAFSDTESHPQEMEIAYATEHGLFQGTGGTLFSPNHPLTRSQAVTVLARQAKGMGEPCAAFEDVSADAYYQSALGWAYRAGLLDNASPEFGPEHPMTHEELTTLLGRYLAWLGRSVTTVPATGSGPLTRAEAAAYFAALDQTLLARDTAVRTLKASDGVTLTGKLDLPAGDEPIQKLVLFVNGSGPNTYENRRQSGDLDFNYFDLFAEQFGARDVGFFRWNTRGVSLGTEPPTFDAIDEALYKTYLPDTSVSDIGAWIADLRKDSRLKDAEIWLLGWSEGTIIAPLAVQKFPDEIAGLLLAGYCNDRMDEILAWQQSGGSSMVFYRQYFDTDGDGAISSAEYTADPHGVGKKVLGDIPFGDIDLTGDGLLTADDFSIMLKPGYTALLDAIERGDDAWLASNYGVRLTSGWFKAHEALSPNRETLLTLDLPIYIFQGTADQNCDVEGARAIEKSFAEQGKTNLTVRIYEGYDHDLLYTLYPLQGIIPQAFEDLFQTVAQA